MSSRPIYLDYHATTPVDPRVVDAMLPYFSEEFGNAASRIHAFGTRADRAVGDARLQVLDLIGAKSPDEIVFTSGATESNNLAIRGVVEAMGGGHVVTSAVEHPCVVETCRYLERRGVGLTVVGVDSEGLVDPKAVDAAIRADTRLVSVMAVNNEIGTIQPIAEIAVVAKRRGVLFHTDAAQAVGRIPIDVQAMGVDLLSISAHKMYGPKGIGALYVRQSPKPTPISRQMHGGSHERGLRSGTLNVPGIAGFGEAARIAREEGASETERITALRDRLLDVLRREVPHLRVHGSLERRVGGNLNVRFGDIEADTFLFGVPELAISGGAACASGKAEASHVLMALGLSQADANRALRIAIGRFTTEADVDEAARVLVAAAHRLAQR